MEIAIGSGVGLVLGLIGYHLFLVIRKNEAGKQADAIRGEAERDVSSRLKETELKIKEMELASKAKMDDQNNRAKDELRDRERELDRRESNLHQQTDSLKKQEKIVEGTQRRLTDKLEQVSQKDGELAKVLDKQRHLLHEASGLGKEEATTRLLDLLEDELAGETGAIILKHEKAMQEKCDCLLYTSPSPRDFG